MCLLLKHQIEIRPMVHTESVCQKMGTDSIGKREIKKKSAALKAAQKSDRPQMFFAAFRPHISF